MSALLLLLALLGSVPWWWAPGDRARSGGRAVVGRRGPGRLGSTHGARGTSRDVGPLRRPDRHAQARTGGVEVDVDAALLLELVAAAFAAGAPVPRALSTVADALPGPVGDALRRAAGALALGSGWAEAWAGAPPAARAVGDALEATATTGASPVPLLHAAAGAARRRRRAAGRAAAGRVGVWLVLPLGLCFLPAFLLLGVVPVVLSIAGRLLG